MSSINQDTTGLSKSPRTTFWIRELPFSLILVAIILGVAYATFSRKSITIYWEVLAPLIGLLCVGAGWHSAGDRAGRGQLIWTQALHWAAFMIVMNMMLLPTVQRNFSANATGLAIFTLLSLGTFTAGVHIPSWHVCLLGLLMALGIPAIAWIENTALFFVLVSAGVLGIVAVFWWHWRERRERSALA